ncbi:DUF262 domain-containing HNH endonuclease family protein [Caulobacter sp. CCNWLY153]|uniref:DUF262 domain-containing protein n=1 Tax=unclassified Caulobacter TaxID=2648921 RepID=UPI002FEF443D
MAIKPTQHGIKVLFEQNHTFQVPKYQRGYAWEDESVEDFLSDITRCLKARASGSPLNHFFGGVVAAKWPIENSNRSNYEVIDGQQRLATFVLLIAKLSQKMSAVVEAFDKEKALSADEVVVKTFLTETLLQLRALYLFYRDNVGMAYVEVRKLTLSEADNEFFQALIDATPIAPQRASHERLAKAWSLIGDFIEATIFGDGPVAGAEKVRMLVNAVLENDCSVIFMAADTRSEAYQIFQVLNDRGVLLTDGDLLRAKTMEALDTDALRPMQAKVAKRWDEVLAYAPKDTDDYLRWYFSSHEGRRPTSSGLADQFMTYRFKLEEGAALMGAKAQSLLGEVKAMSEAFGQLKEMGEGEWPLDPDPKVFVWDRERLRMLVTHLKHTNAMPLLLSLQLLGPRNFATAVASLERFVFRYKTIGNGHATPMTELYVRHAKQIRGNPAAYKISNLKNDLNELLDKHVPEVVFRTNLAQTSYSPRTGNGHVRYLLIAIEDHIDWLKGQAAGTPKCKDKAVVFDFANTTLEHIYPRSAKPADKVAALEPHKDSLGNLTIFGPEENDKLANKSYKDKRSVLKKSKLRINRDISDSPTWGPKQVKDRTAAIIDMAVKLFIP